MHFRYLTLIVGLLGTLLCSFQALAQKSLIYQAQVGDTPSVILYSLGLYPVSERLEEFEKLNNWVSREVPYLMPGEWVKVPSPDPLFEANYSVSPEGAVSIKTKIRSQKEKEEFLLRIAKELAKESGEKLFYYRAKDGDAVSLILYSLGLSAGPESSRQVIGRGARSGSIKGSLNPDLIHEEQILLIPKPNPDFSWNYTLLPDGEVLIKKLIEDRSEMNRLQKASQAASVAEKKAPEVKEEFVDEEERAIVPLEEKIRQLKKFYINAGVYYGRSFASLANTEVNGGETGSVENTTFGAQAEFSKKLKHNFKIALERVVLPKTNSGKFSRESFYLYTAGYYYARKMSQSLTLNLGVERRNRVVYTNVEGELVKTSKVGYFAPFFGGRYYFDQEIFSFYPILESGFCYRPETTADGETVSSGAESFIKLSGFYNLDENSHLEIVLGASYFSYKTSTVRDEELSMQTLFKYGREFWW